MKAAETMARRHDLYHTLVDIDTRISMAYMQHEVSSALDLLGRRVKVCTAMARVGYEPWDVDELELR